MVGKKSCIKHRRITTAQFEVQVFPWNAWGDRRWWTNACSQLSFSFPPFPSFPPSFLLLTSTTLLHQNSLPSLLPPSTLLVFTQLHQLRRHTWATAIMPSEGTTEDGELDRRVGACLGGRDKREEEISSKADWLKDQQSVKGIQAWDILYCSHQTTERWDHSQSVCLLPAAHWSYHELTCFKK